MKKTFRVYFKDGNQKLYEAPSMVAVLNHIEVASINGGYKMLDVYRIEEVEE